MLQHVPFVLADTTAFNCIFTFVTKGTICYLFTILNNEMTILSHQTLKKHAKMTTVL